MINLKSNRVSKKKVIGTDIYYKELDNYQVDDDFFCFNHNEFEPYSLNEYFEDRKWAINRIKTNKDLGFKNKNARIITPNSIEYDSVVNIDSISHVDDKVFIYDYAWGNNYQHWLLTSLGRLFVYCELKKVYPELKLLLHSSSPKYKLDAISLLDINKEDIIIHSGTNLYRKIIIPSFHSGSGKNISDFSYRYYDLLLQNAKKLDLDITLYKKIYISRDDSNGKRPLKNRNELDLLLSENGYKKILLEEYSLSEKIIIFNSAEYITGDFSAGWGHIVFCNKDCNLLLIEHDIFKFSKFYNKIANYRNDNFTYINSESFIRKLYLKILKAYWYLRGTIDINANKIRWNVDLKKIRERL